MLGIIADRAPTAAASTAASGKLLAPTGTAL